MRFVDLEKSYQHYKDEIDQGIQKVLDSACYIMGPEIEELEKRLSDYLGVKHVLAVSSGTDSLLIALMAAGIKSGDEVITTPFTWISTAEVISLLSAKPVFVDIDEKTYNIDPQKIEEAITERTKAIIPVSLFGQVADLDPILEIGEKHNLFVLEDGAQSFGAVQKGKKSLSIAHVSSTSFFPAKPLGCFGDGGALFTDDEELYRIMKAIRNHGGEVRHHHPYLGLNGRMDSIQAAVLLAKLPHYNKEVLIRQKIGASYDTALKERFITPFIMEGNTHVFAQYTLRHPRRDEVMALLQEKGIPTQIYYPKCLHEQPVFAHLGFKDEELPCAIRASREVFSIPMHPFLEEREINFIIESLLEVDEKVLREASV